MSLSSRIPCFTALALTLLLVEPPRLRAQQPGAAQIEAQKQRDNELFTRTSDVIYGEKTGLIGEKLGVFLGMDVFQPKTKPNGRAILFVVSGGWISQRASILSALPRDFVARGYTVFAVVHGTRPKFTIPEILLDMHRAVRFVRFHASDYGIDPDKIGIFGVSSGGHLSLMQGTAGTEGNPQAEDPVERMSSRVQSVACFYAPTDFLNFGKEGEEALGNGRLKDFAAPFYFSEFNSKTKRYELIAEHERVREIGKAISPISHINDKTPPILIIHGDADPLVPIQQGERFVEQMKKVGATAELIVKSGAAHGWPGMGTEIKKMADWFDQTLK